MIRLPAVAGHFYPADPGALGRMVGSLLDPREPRQPARALLVPHAGYVYSGPCAGKVYSAAVVPERVVVLCPNHTGLGVAVALVSEGEWETPLGRVPVDGGLARAIARGEPAIEEDESAHRREHSLEVQLPFLQTVQPALRLVPLCLGTLRRDLLLRVGDAIARAILEEGGDALIVISSDMSHYISAERARALDAQAIAAMESLDPGRLHDVVRREGITMCGVGPAVAGLRAAALLGASRGRLVCYTHSGERTGNNDEVVAYAGMVFT